VGFGHLKVPTQNPYPNTQKIPYPYPYPYPYPNTQKIPYPYPNTQKITCPHPKTSHTKYSFNLTASSKERNFKIS